MIHENRGLTDHIREVAGRFAASGYSALALDLLSQEGGTRRLPRRGARSAALSAAAATPERFDADMQAAVTELKRRLGRRSRVAAIGFCFGGGMVWRLLASGERRLAAAAPFYGPFPEGGDLRRSRAAVLGVYAGLDTRVNATREPPRRRSPPRGCPTRSSPSPRPITPSSTTRTRSGSTRRPRPRPGGACWAGSTATSTAITTTTTTERGYQRLTR